MSWLSFLLRWEEAEEVSLACQLVVTAYLVERRSDVDLFFLYLLAEAAYLGESHSDAFISSRFFSPDPRFFSRTLLTAADTEGTFRSERIKSIAERAGVDGRTACDSAFLFCSSYRLTSKSPLFFFFFFSGFARHHVRSSLQLGATARAHQRTRSQVWR